VTPRVPFVSRVPTRCTARNFPEEEPQVDPDPEATVAVPMTTRRAPPMPTAEAAEAQLQSSRQGAWRPS